MNKEAYYTIMVSQTNDSVKAVSMSDNSVFLAKYNPFGTEKNGNMQLEPMFFQKPMQGKKVKISLNSPDG